MTRRKPDWTPPARNGVGPSRVGIGPGGFQSVLDFLVVRFPNVGDWAARIAAGDVLDAAGERIASDAPCVPGSALWYWRQPPPETPVPFGMELLYRDDTLVVVDKPHFLATMPGGRHLQETALVRLRQQLDIDTLTPMHRLDRDTAGVLVFLVRPDTRHAYHSLLRDRQVHKVYEAVAPWRADLALPLVIRSRLESPAGADFMQVQVVDGEPNAETLVEIIGRVEPASVACQMPLARLPLAQMAPLAHYRLTPHTGRKHQLRAQMNALGLPIVGDRIYPRLVPEPAPGAVPDYSQPLQLLAREFGFADPVTGQQRLFVSRQQLQWATPSGTAREP